jgi:predicted ATP-binding protein involved in virulence
VLVRHGEPYKLKGKDRTMKIINLQANNILKLTAIDITPTDNMIMITGKNGAGKSSVLDCIVMALKGGREIPEVPIKKAANKGKIRIDLGEYTITRSFTKENTYLKIEQKSGKPIKSPQKFLDELVGNVSFDPLSFMNNEKKKQRDILLEILGFDADSLDKKEYVLRKEREAVGRDKTKLQTLYEAIPVSDITDTEEVSVEELSAQLAAGYESNNKKLREWNENELVKEKAKATIGEIKLMEDKILNLKTLVEEQKAQYLKERERLSEVETVDVEALQTKMAELSETNKTIRNNKDKQEAKRELEATTNNYDALTRQIENIGTERKQLLSSTKIPVQGLEFNESELLFNGIPLSQASDGEKLMVSLGISMALNPELRVLRIKDGSLLDASNRKILYEAIKDKDYQLWFESVGDDGDTGILIEEGEVVKVDGVPVPAIPSKPKESAPVPETVKAPEIEENKEIEEEW